jgi:TPP-dependent pyruvate/acetoin dehydrogenase alpha subunit
MQAPMPHRPATDEALPGDLAIALYEAMARTRGVGSVLVSASISVSISIGGSADAPAPCPPPEPPTRKQSHAAGDEAFIVGAAAGMDSGDWIFPFPYAFGAALWRGMPVESALRRARGLEGPWPADPHWKAGRVASASLAGRHLAHAVGAAWGARVRRTADAVLALIPSDAPSGGDFHTALNFAGVTRAPVVVVCALKGVAAAAVAYGLHGARADGSDVGLVLSVVREARTRAASGQGATLIEATLPEDEGADPLARMRRQLESRALWDEGRERQLHATIESALASANAATHGGGDKHDFLDDVYARPHAT